MDPSEDATQVDRHLDANLASDQANRCRRLAQSINDRDTARMLEDLAAEYERRGATL